VMDGYEATRQIRKLPEGDKVKIVAPGHGIVWRKNPAKIIRTTNATFPIKRDPPRPR